MTYRIPVVAIAVALMACSAEIDEPDNGADARDASADAAGKADSSPGDTSAPDAAISSHDILSIDAHAPTDVVPNDALTAGDAPTTGPDAAISPIAGEPLLEHIGVAISPLDGPNGVAGDLIFLSSGPTPLGPFGGPDPDGAGVRPNFGFRVKHGAKVRSPLHAKLQNRLWQPKYQDWELHLVPKDKTKHKWLIIIDHVTDTPFKPGDSVPLNAIVGVAAKLNPSWSLVELHILREPAKPGDKAVHLCPLDVLKKAPLSAISDQLTQLYAARKAPPWRFKDELKGMVRPGCVCTAISETPGAGKQKLSCD